jgi:hypothetical protein
MITENNSFISEVLNQYGLAMDVGIVVIIVVGMIMVEKYIDSKYHKHLDFLPLIIASIVVLFMSESAWIEYEARGIVYAIKIWMSETLKYMAGCFITYNLVYKKILEDKLFKTK